MPAEIAVPTWAILLLSAVGLLGLIMGIAAFAAINMFSDACKGVADAINGKPLAIKKKKPWWKFWVKK